MMLISGVPQGLPYLLYFLYDKHLADDIVIEDVPFGMVMNGKNSVKEGYKGFFSAVPDFKIEPKSWVTNDRSFAVEVMPIGTQREIFQVCLQVRSASPSGDAPLENLKTAS